MSRSLGVRRESIGCSWSGSTPAVELSIAVIGRGNPIGRTDRGRAAQLDASLRGPIAPPPNASHRALSPGGSDRPAPADRAPTPSRRAAKALPAGQARIRVWAAITGPPRVIRWTRRRLAEREAGNCPPVRRCPRTWPRTGPRSSFRISRRCALGPSFRRPRAECAPSEGGVRAADRGLTLVGGYRRWPRLDSVVTGRRKHAEDSVARGLLGNARFSVRCPSLLVGQRGAQRFGTVRSPARS